MSYDYNIIFIGGGLNYAGAIIANRAGLKCAIVEKNPLHLGGTCLHNGCIPSKMYLETAREILGSRREWFEGDLRLNIAKLDQAKEELLARATKGITNQCKGIDIIQAEATISSPHIVNIGDREISGEYIIIGTGSKPFIPEGVEYNGKDIITSDDVLNMKELPKKVSVYGDGAIGLEMASFFASIGVETELIFRHDRLFRKAHSMISVSVEEQLKQIGVELIKNSEISTAEIDSDGIDIRYKDGSTHHTPTLLIATGRRANIDVVNTEKIAIDSRGIVTDEHFETTLKNHYAIGDCNGKIQLAHAARAEILYVVKRILGKNPELIDLSNIVKFIHTLPCSYAFVGRIRSDFERDNEEYRESVVPLKGLPFAHTHDGDLGVMVVYADSDGFIAGGEIFAPYAEELIGIVSMAIAGELDIDTAKRTILAHPTFSESLEKAFLRL